MTLIAAYLDPEDAIAIAGDLLMTSPNKRERPSTVLPAQIPGRPVGDTSCVTGLKQKVVRIDERIYIAWAGSLIVARGVLTWVAENALGLQTATEVIDKICSNYPDLHSLPEVALIIAVSDDGKCGSRKITLESYNCTIRETEDGGRIHCAGTGEYHFLDSMSFEEVGRTGAGNIGINLIAKVFSNIALSFLSETQGWANYEFSYGGAFEVLTLNNDGWKKVSYVLHSWLKEGTGITPVNPITKASYQDDGCLLIDQFLPNGTELLCRRFKVDSPLQSFAPIADAVAYPTRVIDLHADLAVHYLFDSQRSASTPRFQLEWSMLPAVSFREMENGYIGIWTDTSRILGYFDQY